MPGGGERPTTGRRPGVEPEAGRAIGAVIAIIVALVIAPIIVLAQAGPLRGQGQAEPAAPTTTAGTAQLDRGGPDRDPSSPLDDASRPHAPTVIADSQPSRRPRPDPAPVVLVPTVAVTPESEPAPTRVRVQDRDRTRRRPTLARVWPVAPGSFEISQPFGCVPQLLGYYPVVNGCPAAKPSFHNGLDFAAKQGTPIYAVASGWVIVAGRDRASGVANTQIVIQHDGVNDGYATEYYHWITAYVEPGDYVRAGELIAEVGSVGYSTGPHLHFTVVDYSTNQRIDPAGWLPAGPSGSTYAEADSDPDPGANTGGIVVRDYIDPTPLPVRTAP